MRTFEMTAALDFKLIVPDTFLKDMRDQAASEDASAFLKVVQATHPEDNDAFLLMILSNGVKRHLRSSITELAAASNIGGTFAPVRMKDRTPLHFANPVLAQEVSSVIPE